jgi:hypothetical protein
MTLHELAESLWQEHKQRSIDTPDALVIIYRQWCRVESAWSNAGFGSTLSQALIWYYQNRFLPGSREYRPKHIIPALKKHLFAQGDRP